MVEFTFLVLKSSFFGGYIFVFLLNCNVLWPDAPHLKFAKNIFSIFVFYVCMVYEIGMNSTS